MAKKQEMSEYAACIDRISNAMKKFYDTEEMTLDTAKSIIKEIEADLITVLPDLQERDKDFRLGNATYGYDGHREDAIVSNLEYISDRWGTAFRVAWILGLVNEGYR